MISWTQIQDLHAVERLTEIVGRWFSIDLVYLDEFGRLKNDFDPQKFNFKSYLFKVHRNSPKGKELLLKDVEIALKQIEQTQERMAIFETSLPGVKGMICRLQAEGENLGYIMAYCYAKDDFTSEDGKKVVKELVSYGLISEEAELAVKKLKRIEEIQEEYLKDLVGLFADEVSTYNEEIIRREQIIKDLNSEVSNKYRYHKMIGKSKPMQEIYRLLEKIASSESTILVQGENGTGKELVAKAIHYNSVRKDKIFLAQNCSAFNDNLLDSELFGHVKGAFTGAVKDKKGLFEIADGGTLFLDEIGDTSLTMQVKLLRVLQEGTFLPVGATTPKKVNVRVIAATNKPLKEMIQNGEFREDLYYRINVINVNLPPLRERGEDIPLLLEYFLEKKCKEKNLAEKEISKKCLEKLLDYQWPGNIRELENEVERMIVLASQDQAITPDLLSQKILDSVGGGQVLKAGDQTVGFNINGTLRSALEEVEMMMISEGLKRCNFNKSKLAKELDISRANLISKVDKYDLDKRKKAS